MFHIGSNFENFEFDMKNIFYKSLAKVISKHELNFSLHQRIKLNVCSF